MQPSPIVPSVALVINLVSPVSSGPGVDGVLAWSGLFRRLGLPATWVIDEPKQAKLLAETQLASSGLASSELALAPRGDSPGRFFSDLANRLAAVRAVAGQQASVVVGDPRQLRPRAAMLAELGIGAVVSDGQSTFAAKPPKQLPCGLWQLEPTVRVAGTKRRWTLLPARRMSLTQVLDSRMAAEAVLIEIAADEMSRCENLLHEIAQAAGEQQLVVSTVSQIAAKLASQHEVKPQRSILRVAA